MATIEEIVTEISTRQRVCPTLPSDLDAIRTIHAQVLQDRERLRGELELMSSDRDRIRTALADAQAKILWCENRIRELEGSAPPPPVDLEWSDDFATKPLHGFGDYCYNGEGDIAARMVRWSILQGGGLRAKLKQGSPAGVIRTEMGRFNAVQGGPAIARAEPFNTERVYGLSVRIPSAGFVPLNEKLNIFQFWPDPDPDEIQTGRNPVLACEQQLRRLRLVRAVSPTKIQVENDVDRNPFPLWQIDPLELDKWYRFVIATGWVYKPTTTTMEIYMNSQKVVTFTGATTNPDELGNRMTWGAYAPALRNAGEIPAGHQWQVDFAHLRVGGAGTLRGILEETFT